MFMLLCAPLRTIKNGMQRILHAARNSKIKSLKNKTAKYLYKISGRLFYFNPGDDLRSHTVARAVSSAQRGLTSVFGMGTGVTPAIWPPGKSNLFERREVRV